MQLYAGGKSGGGVVGGDPAGGGMALPLSSSCNAPPNGKEFSAAVGGNGWLAAPSFKARSTAWRATSVFRSFEELPDEAGGLVD